MDMALYSTGFGVCGCMTLEACTDRELPEKVRVLMAHQRDAPIHIRMMTQQIHDFNLPDGQTFLAQAKRLVAFKEAVISIVYDPKMVDDKGEAFLQDLVDAGVRVFPKRAAHAKMVLLESRNEKGVLLMSANLTPNGQWKAKETGIFILNDFEEVFSKLYGYIGALLKEGPDQVVV